MNRALIPAALLVLLAAAVAVPGSPAQAPKPADPIPWPAGLPVYDHVVIVVEENKDYDQIVGSPDAPFVNRLRKEGANFTKMFGEEHNSQGNYFWMFSGSNHGVGFRDGVPDVKIRKERNLAASLIANRRTFKGYSEDLPAIGSEALVGPEKATGNLRGYARKHVPWISFDNVPNGKTVRTSCNLRFEDFPTDEAGFASLPTVAFVIPNLQNDMHDRVQGFEPEEGVRLSIRKGDRWLEKNLGAYYRWAGKNNSLLIVTFDENDDRGGYVGLTDPFVPADTRDGKDLQNQICTIFAGARIKPGDYDEGKGITHINILRTLEAMYGLPRAGAQQPNAARGGIADDYIITDVFN
jgi:hypothetical protein